MEYVFSADLFSALTMGLEQKGIQYFILRNYEGLPEINSSKDVDILIKSEDLSSVINCLKEKASELRYTLVWKNCLDYLYGFVFMKIENEVVFSIKIDLFRSFSWRGMIYIDDNFLFKEVIKYNGFYVLPPSCEAFTMIMYYVLCSKKIQTKYFEVIRRKALSDKLRFMELMRDHVGEDVSQKILICLHEEKIGDIVLFRSRFVRAVIKRNIRVRFFADLFKHVLLIIYNFKNPVRVFLNIYINNKYRGKNKFIWDSLSRIGVVKSSYSKLTSEFFQLLKVDESI